jgi:glycosyltransferase involved in cell wall biosynthesis
MPVIGRSRVSVVIPAKNEARNIGWVLERLPVWVDEVVLVDGRSTDRTVEVASAIRPDIVVVRDDEPGKGAALRAGISAATGELIVMLDADGSMDPAEIEAFVNLLYRGHDLVKGSRFLRGGGTADMSILRATGNRALLTVGNILFGVSHTDLCYGFAAFRRDRILSLELDAVGFEIETQMFLRAIRQGLDVVEVPSFEAPRRYGTSNLNTFRDGWRVLRTIFAERLRTRMAPVQAIPIEAEPIAISIEPGMHNVASMVSDAYSMSALTVSTQVESFVE